MVKVSVFVRNTDIIWSYKGNFWEEVYARITKVENLSTTIHIGKGRFQHQFYFASEREAEYFRNLIKNIIGEIVPDEDLFRGVIISAAVADAGEISKLNETVEKNPENAAFWAAAEKLGAGKTSEEKNTAENPTENIGTAARKRFVDFLGFDDESEEKAEDSEEKAEEKAEEKTEEKPAASAPESLAEKAKKIRELKELLLANVKGQRHAVEVMVQSIFECEMFASRNPDRKGPLATFLFTGPSGVGKTFLASLCSEHLGRGEPLIVDMSEFSNNLSNNRFNGEHGQDALVTKYARKNPNGIIIFDEIEKAHINTIHLFLQILDGGRLMDHNIKKNVSFKDNIIIMTTNAGKELYDDATVCDLSATPRSVIIDALKKDVNPQTGEPFFPECITTRMANGHVILFNHLEPYALMEIVRSEIEKQVGFFQESSGIKVEYNAEQLAALVLYNGGGVSDARTLRGLAKNIIVRELQEIIMQIYEKNPDAIGELKTITLNVDVDDGDSKELFVNSDKMYAAVLANDAAGSILKNNSYNTEFDVISDADLFKRRVRGVTDFVLIDPLFGVEEEERIPNDVEDIESLGMHMFDYIREFAPEVPVYILDTSSSVRSFDTLLARGAKGVIKAGQTDGQLLKESLKNLVFSALINNSVYSLGRACKYLTYNCAQYIIDPTCAVVSFEKLLKKSAPQAGDGSMIASKGSSTIMFDDVIGCKDAKQALSDYRDALNNPREVAVSGKRMPKGILLYGPPGTGKTMLAKAMANECNATFFPTSATSFFGPLVGQTEQNIRELFRKARKYAPSIIFVDEVDAIARKRTGGISSVHNEDALNTFLAEMDGFVVDEKRPVFLIAATNYEIEGEGSTVLDRAFVRRFDSKILIPLPDTDDRYRLLALSLKKHGIHFGENHEEILRNMAERTAGMNNADLEKMNSEYVRILADGEPDSAKYMDALDSYRYGEANKMDPEALRQTACHEAGHALVCRLCGEKPSFLTVVSRGRYGGYMLTASDDTKGNYTYDELMNRVCVSLAGRVAEIECYGENLGMNTGASSDIKHARYIIRVSLDDYAMGDQLFARWKATDAEALMRAQYERTRTMICEHKDTLIRLADLLVKEKCLDSRQMEEFFKSENI